MAWFKSKAQQGDGRDEEAESSLIPDAHHGKQVGVRSPQAEEEIHIREGTEVDDMPLTTRVDAADAPKAAQTFDEAWALLAGKGALKPDAGRVYTTVCAGLGAGYLLGWQEGRKAAAKYPSHQRTLIKRRMALGRGAKIAAFTLVYEGSVACLTALRQKEDFVNGAIGGALTGTAFGAPGGLASAGRGLFIGTWLGAVLGAFHNTVKGAKAERKMKIVEQKLEEELQEVEEELRRKMDLQDAIDSMNTRVEAVDAMERERKSQDAADDAPDGGSKPQEESRRRWWKLW